VDVPIGHPTTATHSGPDLPTKGSVGPGPRWGLRPRAPSLRPCLG